MEELTKRVIGQQINAALASKDVKQKELAKYLNVPDNTISYFVSGKRVPNTEQIIKIADFLKVSTDYLLGITKTRTALDNDEGRLVRSICDYTGLSEDSIEELHKLVEFRDQEENEFPWLEDMFLDNKRWAGETLQVISYIICNDEFREAVGDIIGYTDSLKSRIDSINSLIEKINQKDKLDYALVSEIDNLTNVDHNKAVRLAYFEMIESLKTATEKYCNSLIQRYEEAEIKLGKYWGEAALYSHSRIVYDEQAKEIRKEIMNSCLSLTETVNVIAKKMGETNANNNETQ